MSGRRHIIIVGSGIAGLGGLCMTGIDQVLDLRRDVGRDSGERAIDRPNPNIDSRKFNAEQGDAARVHRSGEHRFAGAPRRRDAEDRLGHRARPARPGRRGHARVRGEPEAAERPLLEQRHPRQVEGVVMRNCRRPYRAIEASELRHANLRRGDAEKNA